MVDSASGDETVASRAIGCPRADGRPGSQHRVWPREQHRRRCGSAAGDGARQPRRRAAGRLAARARGRGPAGARAAARPARAQRRRLPAGHGAPARRLRRPISAGCSCRRGLAPRRAVLPLAPWRSDRPRRVGWAVGCALVARTDTLRRLGPFDERIFLYCEDLDLGLRAGEEGIETWFCPSARVLHHRAHSQREEFGGEPFELLARARREVVARRLGARRAVSTTRHRRPRSRRGSWASAARRLGAARAPAAAGFAERASGRWTGLSTARGRRGGAGGHLAAPSGGCGRGDARGGPELRRRPSAGSRPPRRHRAPSSSASA